MLSPLYIWLIGYALPATLGGCMKFVEKNFVRRGLYVHLLVAVSVITMLYLGEELFWNISLIGLIMFGAAWAISILLIKRIGLFYPLSVLLQESCLLLSIFILYPLYGIWIATGATALLFFAAHNIRREGWWWKPLLLYTWVLFSAGLYMYTQQPLIGASIHLLIGSLLIYEGSLLKYRFDS